MNSTIYIPIGSKKVALHYSPDPNNPQAIKVKCKEAWLEQWFLLEDLGGLIQNIPLMVQKRQATKENILRVRVSPKEKLKISELASQKWFSSLSAYIRSVALS